MKKVEARELVLPEKKREDDDDEDEARAFMIMSGIGTGLFLAASAGFHYFQDRWNASCPSEAGRSFSSLGSGLGRVRRYGESRVSLGDRPLNPDLIHLGDSSGNFLSRWMEELKLMYRQGRLRRESVHLIERMIQFEFEAQRRDLQFLRKLEALSVEHNMLMDQIRNAFREPKI